MTACPPIRMLLLAMMAPFGLASCVTPRGNSHAHPHGRPTAVIELKRGSYPMLPCAPYSEELRAKAAGNPELRDRFFWGNYGGPGCSGGEPVDAMDQLFYQHDIAYLEGIKLRDLRRADRLLIRQLKALDPDALTPEARSYRRKAMVYFRLPISRWVGKPKDVLLRRREGSRVRWVE